MARHTRAAAAWIRTSSSWTSAPATPPTDSRPTSRAGPAGPLLGKPGGVFVLDADKVSADDAVLLTAAARAVLGGGRRSLADQLDRRPAAAALPPPLRSTRTDRSGSPFGTVRQRLPRAYGSGTATAGSHATVAST